MSNGRMIMRRRSRFKCLGRRYIIYGSIAYLSCPAGAVFYTLHAPIVQVLADAPPLPHSFPSSHAKPNMMPWSPAPSSSPSTPALISVDCRVTSSISIRLSGSSPQRPPECPTSTSTPFAIAARSILAMVVISPSRHSVRPLMAVSMSPMPPVRQRSEGSARCWSISTRWLPAQSTRTPAPSPSRRRRALALMAWSTRSQAAPFQAVRACLACAGPICPVRGTWPPSCASLCSGKGRTSGKPAAPARSLSLSCLPPLGFAPKGGTLSRHVSKPGKG